MMLNDELVGFDGESAVTYINAGVSTDDSSTLRSHFTQHRAVGACLHHSSISFSRQTEDSGFCSLSLPSKPSSKIELGSSASSRKRSQASSVRCQEKPLFIQKNSSFYLQESDYENIKMSVEKALQSVENDYDWNYFENEGNTQNEHMVSLALSLSLFLC
jgi:hypothetical protein